MTIEKENKTIRIVSNILFAVYICALFYFLFFAEMLGRTNANRDYHYNLILFKEIKRFIIYRHSLGIPAVLANLLGNILIFVPFGMLVPVLSKRYKKFGSVTLVSFELSLAVELIQLITKVGSCDVDDMLLNTIGGMAGFVCFVILRHFRRKRKNGK